VLQAEGLGVNIFTPQAAPWSAVVMLMFLQRPGEQNPLPGILPSFINSSWQEFYYGWCWVIAINAADWVYSW
jgi:hypothetical protein